MDDSPEEDFDIKLQRVSKDLINAFDQRLNPFLRNASGRVRSHVLVREASHLMANLLDPFQELPQLLDPYLPKWLPLLAEAFLDHLQPKTRRSVAVHGSSFSSLLMPLPTAICKLIYTCCKVRGEKVVVNFLNVEPRYLDLLLSALEEADRHQNSQNTTTPFDWSWEERYVVLLWLSQLMFAPFDLSTISSVYMDHIDLAGIPGFLWPFNSPSIAVRILPLAVKYLGSSGRERDAAKALLVRMAARRDMQKLGILRSLIDWALSCLHPIAKHEREHDKSDESTPSPYKYIGVLAFLAGVLSSAETSEVERYSSKVFYTVNAIMWSGDSATSDAIKSSAVAKKMAIKAMRSIAVSKLTRERRGMAGIQLVETAVRLLLRSLADNDTPVRFAASKALSIITLKLPDHMASQVVDAVLRALNKNVYATDQATESGGGQALSKDLTSVDPLEWHGLMLTLSHLLYRRSPPPHELASIIQALLLGLSFEQRNASGGSIGANVRDAACFGIWALARRYSTEELVAVDSEAVRGKEGPKHGKQSVLQVLAIDLVVTASLDPTGNIRRGSSAALQELIGRHPNTVEEGIAIVQAVDYHAVALRSRAMRDVALCAARLDSQYGEAILEALLGWRGVGDAHAAVRRTAGGSYGAITSELAANTSSGLEVLSRYTEKVAQCIQVLQPRQVEESHGLLFALSSVFDQLPELAEKVKKQGNGERVSQLPLIIGRFLSLLESIVAFIGPKTFRRQELILEAACRLFTSSYPVLQMSIVGLEAPFMSGPDILTCLRASDDLAESIPWLGSLGRPESFPPACVTGTCVIGTFERILHTSLGRIEEEVCEAASDASIILQLFLPPGQRQDLVENWTRMILSGSSTIKGYLLALTKSYTALSASASEPTAPKKGQNGENGENGENVGDKAAVRICNALVQRWAHEKDVDIRVWILESVVEGEILQKNARSLVRLILDGLEDYTTDARGDVGSKVRLHAVKAAKHLWSKLDAKASKAENVASATSQEARASLDLVLPVLRLSAEKMDKVRTEAQSTLALVLDAEQASRLRERAFSSISSTKGYFRFLLDLATRDEWLRDEWLDTAFRSAAGRAAERRMDELLAGYVTSADKGNEEVVIASRAALGEHCLAAQEKLDSVCTSLYRNMRARQGQDRVLVPTLEVMAFLLSVGIYQRTGQVDFKSLCLQCQRAGYKTGNVRKLIGCVRVYGGVASMGRATGTGGPTTVARLMAGTALEQKRCEGISEARRRLGRLMLHPWPRLRTAVVDELWGVFSGDGTDRAERLKGVDWGGTTDKAAVEKLVMDLGLS